MEERSQTLTIRRKIWFYGIVVFLVAFIPFAITEVYLRLAYRNIDLWERTGRKVRRNPMAEWALADAFCAYRGRPGAYDTKEGKGTKTVNSYGFISTPEIAPRKPGRTLRIAYLGGSSTAGTGRVLADADTWPWKATESIESALQGMDVEFINGALGGYSSFESYGRLWSRIRFFSPDIIVVYHGWNEMYYFRKVDSIVKWRTLSVGSWAVDRTYAILGTHRPYWIDFLLRRSQVLSRLRLHFGEKEVGEFGPIDEIERKDTTTRLPSRGPGLLSGAAFAFSEISESPVREYDFDALEIWRANLRLMREAAKIMNAELFVVKQATLIVPNLSEEGKKRCRYEYHGFGHDAHVQAFADLYRTIDEEIPDDRVIDASAISGRLDLFIDHVHVNAKGAREIAQIVAEAIIRQLDGRALE